MNKEDLHKMLDDTIAPVVKLLDDLEKGEGQPDPQEKQIDEAVAKEMAAAVGKSRSQVANNLDRYSAVD